MLPAGRRVDQKTGGRIMLDERRKNYVTASQAHRVMAGFKVEMDNAGMVKPEVNDPGLMAYIEKNGKCLVGDAKAAGIVATGAEIAAMHKYVQSLIPIISDGMITVAREIAISEFIKERPEQFESDAMAMGNELEVDAVAMLSARVGSKIDNTGDNQAFFHTYYLSATPDGVIYDDFTVKELAEVKCLQIPSHSKFLHLMKNQDDLLEHAPEYFWQCMAQLEVTGADMVHFQTYCPYFQDDYSLVYVPVYPNRPYMDMLNTRAERVLSIVPEIRQQIIDNPARLGIEG